MSLCRARGAARLQASTNNLFAGSLGRFDESDARSLEGAGGVSAFNIMTHKQYAIWAGEL